MQILKSIESRFSKFTFNSNEARTYAMRIAICLLNHKCSTYMNNQTDNWLLIVQEQCNNRAATYVYTYIKLRRFK